MPPATQTWPAGAFSPTHILPVAPAGHSLGGALAVLAALDLALWCLPAYPSTQSPTHFARRPQPGRRPGGASGIRPGPLPPGHRHDCRDVWGSQGGHFGRSYPLWAARGALQLGVQLCTARYRPSAP